MTSALTDKGIMLPFGQIRKDKINLVSGAVTLLFAETVWETINGDMGTTA
jgi:hypothetical protein